DLRASMVGRAEDEARTPPPIVASDWNAGAIEAARQNAAAAGCADLIRIVEADLAEVEVPAGEGLLACNPPYGKRIGSRDALEGFYGRLGESFAPRVGWRAALLSTDKVLRRTFEAALGRGPSQLRRFRQGGLRVDWTLY